MIDENKWDEFFNLAISQLNISALSDLFQTLYKANIFTLNDLSFIPDGAFISYDQPMFDIPNHIEKLGHKCFAFSKLETVTIPANVIEVESYSFTGCFKLTSVEVKEGVKFLNTGVFSGCSSLTRVELPRSLKTIDETCFRHANNLQEIIYGGTSMEWYALTGYDPSFFVLTPNKKIICKDKIITRS